MIEFVRTDLDDQAPERGLVKQICVMEFQWFSLLAEMLDAGTAELAGAADEPMHGIAAIY